MTPEEKLNAILKAADTEDHIEVIEILKWARRREDLDDTLRSMMPSYEFLVAEGFIKHTPG